MEELKLKIQEAINAADILLEAQLYRPSATKYWEATRSAIFYYLYRQNIHYSDTRQALKAVVTQHLNENLANEIIFAETIATLSEWDEYFEINTEQIHEYSRICMNIISRFANIELSNKKLHRHV